MQSMQTAARAPIIAFGASWTLRTIVIGGAVVGVLDAVDGVAFFGLTAGNNPIQVLQYIASGVLGSAAFSGGLASAGLGALIHFGLALGFTAAFVLAWSRVEVIRRDWVIAGLAWGAAVWALMSLLVLPHSHVALAPLTTLAIVHGIAGHGLFVGLAAAVVARRATQGSDATPVLATNSIRTQGVRSTE